MAEGGTKINYVEPESMTYEYSDCKVLMKYDNA